jgi:hypothetical protein
LDGRELVSRFQRRKSRVDQRKQRRVCLLQSIFQVKINLCIFSYVFFAFSFALFFNFLTPALPSVDVLILCSLTSYWFTNARLSRLWSACLFLIDQFYLLFGFLLVLFYFCTILFDVLFSVWCMDRSWVGLFLFSIGSVDGHDNSAETPHNALVSPGSSFVTAEDSQTSQTTEEDESWQNGDRETNNNPPSLPPHAQSLLLLVNATTGESDVDLVVDGRRYLLFSVGARLDKSRGHCGIFHNVSTTFFFHVLSPNRTSGGPYNKRSFLKFIFPFLQASINGKQPWPGAQSISHEQWWQGTSSTPPPVPATTTSAAATIRPKTRLPKHGVGRRCTRALRIP